MNAQTVTPRAAAKELVAAAAAVLLALPIAADASVDDALDACIEAFVAANVPKDHPVVVNKEEAAASAFHNRGRTVTVTLRARGMTSGRRLAQGTCIADHNGRVIAMDASRARAQKLAAATIAKTPGTAAR